MGLACEGESEGDTEAALDRTTCDLDRGDAGSKFVSSSPILLSGRAGYTVPFSVARVLVVIRDFIERGDKGL